MKPQERQEIFKTLKDKYESEGYKTREHTISVLKANLMVFVTAAPIALICAVIYFNLHPLFENMNSVTIYLDFKSMILIWILAVVFCFIHEFLHGITWGWFCKDKKNISYGVMWKQLTPYCCCAEALTFKRYILGGLMPFLVIGLGMFLVSLVLGNLVIFLLSILNIIGASGDLTVVLMLLKCRNSIIVDHPTKCGFVTFDK
ncbi:MAG: DUF3267 domain-containing protein [Clostridium sp.]